MPQTTDDQIRDLCRVLDIRARHEARLARWAKRRGLEEYAITLLIAEYRRQLFARTERLRRGKADHT